MTIENTIKFRFPPEADAFMADRGFVLPESITLEDADNGVVVYERPKDEPAPHLHTHSGSTNHIHVVDTHESLPAATYNDHSHGHYHTDLNEPHGNHHGEGSHDPVDEVLFPVGSFVTISDQTRYWIITGEQPGRPSYIHVYDGANRHFLVPKSHVKVAG